MSSSFDREPLAGVIRHNEKIVGAICLPDDDVQEFIADFNRCYGPLCLHIEAPELQTDKDLPLLPVGARLSTLMYARATRGGSRKSLDSPNDNPSH
jgi:hypothetical protein